MPSTEGLVINLDWVKAAYRGIQAPSKSWLLSYLSGGPTPFSLMIEMPCGKQMVMASEADIPEKSVPCSCGRPDHWFIKYTEVADA